MPRLKAIFGLETKNLIQQSTLFSKNYLARQLAELADPAHIYRVNVGFPFDSHNCGSAQI
jgi:hypothetical protein